MICQRCLYRASAPRSACLLIRSLASVANVSTTASARPDGTPAAVSTGAAQPFSTPLSPAPNAVSLGANLRPRPAKIVLPVSSAPAGTPLKGLNYLKGREDPLALPEEEYPDWLWRCLDEKKSDDPTALEGDEFSKSKKQRRVAAKRQRKLEAQLLATGGADALAPKVPPQLQTVDLPRNEEGTVEGALTAVTKREELTKAMRRERRSKIKESNFLKGFK